MRHTIYIDPTQALCADTGFPDDWMEDASHQLASKVCERCSQNVDCYLVGLMEQRCGTWGGAWFSEAKSPMKKRSNRTSRYADPYTRRAIERATDFLCDKLNLTREQFVEYFGSGERGVYTAASKYFVTIARQPDMAAISR